MDFKFSFASIYDAPEVVKLVNSAYRGESSKSGWTTEADLLDGQRTDYSEIVNILEQEGSTILTARNNSGEILACCELKIIPGNYFDKSAPSEKKNLYFGMFTVQPLLQNSGIGKIFLTQIENYARQWDLEKIQMSVITLRKELIAYYERRGFQTTSLFIDFPTELKFGVPKIANLKMVILEKKL